MPNFEKSIEKLKSVIFDENCKSMNLSNIKGYLGELLVAQKLITEGCKIKMLGNQSGYDIEIPKTKITIDVKFSTIKSEVKDCPKYWGWALKHKNKKRPITCSHFICVASDEELNPIKYYILKADHLERCPKSAIGQFKNVEKGLVLLKDSNEINTIKKIELRQYFQTCEALVTDSILKEIETTINLSDFF